MLFLDYLTKCSHEKVTLSEPASHLPDSVYLPSAKLTVAPGEDCTAAPHSPTTCSKAGAADVHGAQGVVDVISALRLEVV